ncbi:tetratricopeptide repeat protein [Acinetobacter calcoaceticus]|uniref:tetratricopeptide repeat protein n=1 Tax=Acinetobacter calcoaceticus TaxID=471 RepID=UPI003A845B54
MKKQLSQSKQKITYTFSSDSKSLGKTDAQSPEALDIARKIHNSLQELPSKIVHDTLEQTTKKIEEGLHAEAIELLIQNSFFIFKLKDKRILEVIELIDNTNLDKEIRKSHLLLCLGYASFIGELKKVIKYIQFLESDFSDDLDNSHLESFILERARYAKEEGKRNLAVIQYQELLKRENVRPINSAIAYQGLADLATSNEDSIRYCRLSADKFLEAGEKKDAISNLLLLSKLKAKESPTSALEILETCLKLADADDLIERHGKAHLLQDKATYLYKLGKKTEALKTIEGAFVLDEGIFGAEINLHASYRMAAQYALELGIQDKAKKYTQLAMDIGSTIDDELFILQNKVADYYDGHDQLCKKLLNEVLEFGDFGLIGTVLLKESINPSNTTTNSIELLDSALQYLEKKDEKEIVDLVHFHFGLIYQKQGLNTEAEESYQKSLYANPYNYSAANNLAALYMETEQWEKASKFFSSRIKLLGELPNICFYYGKTLYEQHNYHEALKYFNKANPEVRGLQQLKEECFIKIPQGMITTNFKPEVVVQITSDVMLATLNEFSTTVSAQNRMYFWQSDNKNGYKWNKNPEEIGKQLLIAFLSAKFGHGNIQILQEQRAGAGFIDLYLLLAGGLKVVVELKMCGAPYTSSYAISGKDQIVHYQNNTGSHLGYLVVFDGRKRDFAEGFQKLQIVENKTIYSVAVDVRNTVK